MAFRLSGATYCYNMVLVEEIAVDLDSGKDMADRSHTTRYVQCLTFSIHQSEIPDECRDSCSCLAFLPVLRCFPFPRWRNSVHAKCLTNSGSFLNPTTFLSVGHSLCILKITALNKSTSSPLPLPLPCYGGHFRRTRRKAKTVCFS